jgi:AraC-like DNA-binding protein
MSRSSLYNKIKALTGHSPSEFVKQIRLKQAAILLKSRKHTVAEISDMLGYGDPKYFTDIFKKYYGVTPSNYMKQEQK